MIGVKVKIIAHTPQEDLDFGWADFYGVTGVVQSYERYTKKHYIVRFDQPLKFRGATWVSASVTESQIKRI